MGTFVGGVSGVSGVSIVGKPETIQSDGDWSGGVNPAAPWSIVVGRFDQSAAYAEQYGTLLTGYLEVMSAAIQEYDVSTIVAPTVDIPNLAITVGPAPLMSGSVNTNFPTLDATPFSFTNVPSVNLDGLLPGVLPPEISTAISWLESVYDDTLYRDLLTRIATDMQAGASGVGGTVEQEIYARAIARQAVENDAKYVEIEQYAASRGFDLPTGAMAGRLQEQANVIAANNLDINGKIMIEQADLAQKNNQFILGLAKDLEAVLRDFHGKKNDRSLDFGKAVAANTIAIYTENVKRYLAGVEANRAYVEMHIENLKAIIEHNKALVARFVAEAEANGVAVEAIAKSNEAITEIYKADMQGYAAETGAKAEGQKGNVAAYSLQIQNADMVLRAAIANAEAGVQAYGSEYALREKIATAMANIAMQASSSAFGSVNASAGLSYSGSESKGESWTHGESRSDSYGHSESLTTSVDVGLRNTLSESHDYQEK